MFCYESTASVVLVPDSDLKVVNSARVSFSKESSEMTTGDEGLIRYLATHRHWTPFSHCRETFMFHLTPTDIGHFFANLSQEDIAGMVWAQVPGGLAIRTSIFGWASILNKEVKRWNIGNFIQVYQTLVSKYPVSAKYLFTEETIKKYSVHKVIRPYTIDDSIRSNPYFTDITIREKCPIFVARQRFKHMVGFAYNEVSRRYVDSAPEIFLPKEWREKADNKKQGSLDTRAEYMYQVLDESSSMSRDSEIAYLFSEIGSTYDRMIVNRVAAEQVRMILPQAMMTEYYVTGHLAAWNRFLEQRKEGHAQREIQDLANAVEKEIIKYLNDVDFDLD